MTTVISHSICVLSGCATIVLQDDHGAQRHLRVAVASPKTACAACGRGWPVNATAVDVAAAITAEQASMDSAAAAIVAYAQAQAATVVAGAQPLPPTVTAISPTAPVASAQPQTVAIAGYNLVPGDVVVTSPGGAIATAAVQSPTPTSFVLLFAFSAPGKWSITAPGARPFSVAVGVAQ